MATNECLNCGEFHNQSKCPYCRSEKRVNDETNWDYSSYNDEVEELFFDEEEDEEEIV